MNKESFFQNIRNKLGRTKETAIRPYDKGVPSYYTEELLTTKEKVDLFVQNVEEVGGVAYVHSSKVEACQQIRDILQSHEATSIIRWRDPLLEQIGFDRALENKMGIHIWNEEASKEDNVEISKHCDVGITTADFAIANTGTVGLVSNGRKGRSVSLLPPIYIVVLKEEQIVGRMGETFPLIRENDTSSLNFITGPSKSADIESKLTIGVHGPKFFYAIVLKNES